MMKGECPMFYGIFKVYTEVTHPPKGRQRKPRTVREIIDKTFSVDAPSYHEAAKALAPVRNWLDDTESAKGWELSRITEEPQQNSSPIPELGEEYANLYYEPRYDYELMVIEGTRLLELKDTNNASAYGAYVRNKQTGETSFASPNGTFFTHGEVTAALDRIHKRAPKYDPTATFVWRPILFPYIKKDGEPTIDMTYYVMGNDILSFPAQLLSQAGYQEQAEWIASQEGLM